MKLFAIGDTHFYHTNIIKYCNRPFPNADIMNDVIVANWNQLVNQEDIVIHVGDFALSSKENITKIYNNLNGKKILVMGNHDRQSFKFYSELFDFVSYGIIIKKWFFSHTPMLQIPLGKINIHGHVHNNENAEQWIIKNRKNVSVEMTDYKPIMLENFK